MTLDVRGMLPTPKEHLPKGYPATPTLAESDKYMPVWERAFAFHKGECRNPDSRAGILGPVWPDIIDGVSRYCDCYERAYQEVILMNSEYYEKRRLILMELSLVEL